MDDFSLDPWRFPVPVRRSSFLPLDPRDDVYNIQVAMDRIAPFQFGGPALPEDELALCDHQTSVDVNMPGRFGSGRAGVYRGCYVKGIGRTPLAGNWNDAQDIFHGSGFLSVGSALRELLISRMLQARGASHLIVPVQGLLVRPLLRAEQEALRSTSPLHFHRSSPAELHLAALTVKPGRFARLSNLVWSLGHVNPGPVAVGTLALRLLRYLTAEPADPSAAHGEAEVEGTPEEIAAGLRAAVDRGLAHFTEYAQHGIYWLSFHNNFTLDGRFLDLETPIFFGAPFFGTISESESAPGSPEPGRLAWVGLELFHCAQAWRLFLRHLTGRLRFMAAHLCGQFPESRDYLRALDRAIRLAIPRDHAVFCDEALVDHAVAGLDRAFALGSRDRALVGRIARSAHAFTMYGRKLPLPRLKLRPAPFAPAEATASNRFTFACPDFVADAMITKDALRPGQEFRAALARLDQLTDVDRLLAELGQCVFPKLPAGTHSLARSPS